jgi:hypothetical protein
VWVAGIERGSYHIYPLVGALGGKAGGEKQLPVGGIVKGAQASGYSASSKAIILLMYSEFIMLYPFVKICIITLERACPFRSNGQQQRYNGW